MTLYNKDGSSVYETDKAWVKTGSSAYEIDKMWIKSGSSLYEFYSGTPPYILTRTVRRNDERLVDTASEWALAGYPEGARVFFVVAIIEVRFPLVRITR